MKSRFIVLPLILLACAKETNAHGWEDLEEHRKTIVVGKMSAQDVLDQLGQPSATDPSGQKEWYYIQLIEEGFSITPLKTKTHKMMRIMFNGQGIVKSVTLEDIQSADMPLVKEKTKTSGYQEGLLKDTFGRVGQR